MHPQTFAMVKQMDLFGKNICRMFCCQIFWELEQRLVDHDRLERSKLTVAALVLSLFI